MYFQLKFGTEQCLSILSTMNNIMMLQNKWINVLGIHSQSILQYLTFRHSWLNGDLVSCHARAIVMNVRHRNARAILVLAACWWLNCIIDILSMSSYNVCALFHYITKRTLINVQLSVLIQHFYVKPLFLWLQYMVVATFISDWKDAVGTAS